MLKSMRKHARYFYVLFFIVILTFIFWGVGTVDKSGDVPVATVEDQKIGAEAYWTAYERARNFYREIFKERFTEEMEKQLNLKQRTIDSLIDEQVLLIAAERAGITITDKELQDAIVNDPLFVREGAFSQEVYIRTLQLNRLTPELFESMKRRELTTTKMRRLIGESVEVTDAELPASPGNEQAQQARQALLLEKRDRAVKSYVEGLKKDLKITINQQLIS